MLKTCAETPLCPKNGHINLARNCSIRAKEPRQVEKKESNKNCFLLKLALPRRWLGWLDLNQRMTESEEISAFSRLFGSHDILQKQRFFSQKQSKTLRNARFPIFSIRHSNFLFPHVPN